MHHCFYSNDWLDHDGMNLSVSYNEAGLKNVNRKRKICSEWEALDQLWQNKLTHSDTRSTTALTCISRWGHFCACNSHDGAMKTPMQICFRAFRNYNTRTTSGRGWVDEKLADTQVIISYYNQLNTDLTENITNFYKTARYIMNPRVYCSTQFNPMGKIGVKRK